MGEPQILKGETCPMCRKKTLTLIESEKDIPHFGICFVFGMDCSSCDYHMADLEMDNNSGPVKYTLDVTDEKDMHIRVVKSSTATIKIPHVGSIEPGAVSNGYITNVEGILNRLKTQIEKIRDNDEEEKENRKKAKNLVKKITKIIWGHEKAKMILEDPNGNSAIISPKALKGSGKKK